MTALSVQTSVAAPLNALTVDVEDWPQSVLDPRLPITQRFCANTRRILASFAAQNVTGTFFVLGLAAEKAPELVREIQSAGHEIQSHGYGHERLTALTPGAFRADVERSKKLLEDLTGREVYGYRAPVFSITTRTLWALDCLVELGFRYDSSVFPVRTRRYGIEGAPHYPHILTTPQGGRIKEFPVASYRIARRRVPTGGGGYFRLFPYAALRGGLQQLNAQGYSATVYMHPYEYAPNEIADLDYPVSWKMRLHQSLGRKGFAEKVKRMLCEFRFGTIQDVIESTEDWPRHEYQISSS